MNEEEPKVNSKTEQIKKVAEFFKTPRGKGILFFGFYFVFFAIIIVFLRTNDASGTNLEYEDSTTSSIYSISKIKQDNYHFKYTYTLDGSSTIYEGDNYYGNINLTKTTNNVVENYYLFNDIYYTKINGVLSKVDLKESLKEFTDIDIIEGILEESYQESKTEFGDRHTLFNLQVTTNTLEKNLTGKDLDIADIPNTITLTTDESGEVVNIAYNLSSYTTYKSIASTAFLTLEYSNFSNVEEITEE